MLTLAEVKRQCAVGRKLTMTFHRFPQLWRSDSLRRQILAGALTREITRVQRNGVYLATEGRESFLNWPKATEFRVTGPDTFDVLASTDDPDMALHSVVMSYRIEPDDTPKGE